MDALETLSKLVEDASSLSDFRLSNEELNDHFEKLLSAAHVPKGYGTLCWEAGAWLLLLSGDKYNLLFNAYGYPAIATAMSTAMESGNLPSGLGWYTAGFLPGDVDGDIMLGVLSHPLVHAALTQGLAAREFTINMKLIDPYDEQLGKALSQFLEYLHRVGMDRQTQLTWAARLTEHISAENPAREMTIRLVLEGLIQTGRYINAFYWLKSFFNEFDDIRDEIFEVVSEIAKIIQSMGENGYRIFGRMSEDEKLERILFSSARSRLMLSLILFGLLLREGIKINQRFIDRSTALMWKDHPELALFIKTVTAWALEVYRDEESTHGDNVEHKARTACDLLRAPQEKAQALQRFREELEHVPFFRGQTIPVEVWKECRDEVFEPLVSSLESAGYKELQDPKEAITDLDPDSLIRSSQAYKASLGHRRLKAGSQKMLSTDFRKHIQKLVDLLELCYEANKAMYILSGVSKEIDMALLVREYEGIASKWPSMTGCINEYLAPVVTEWRAAQERVGL